MLTRTADKQEACALVALIAGIAVLAFLLGACMQRAMRFVPEPPCLRAAR